MNEWKDLHIINLPEDFLVGEYEVQYKHTARGWTKANAQPYEIIGFMCRFHIEYRYRKPEPLPPTHAEIMTKWWKQNNDVWFRVLEYDIRDGKYLTNYNDRAWIEKSYFTNRESADIPPEAV